MRRKQLAVRIGSAAATATLLSGMVSHSAGAGSTSCSTTDSFDRSVSSGWGKTSTGYTWSSPTGGSGSFIHDGKAKTRDVRPGQSTRAQLQSLSTTDVRVDAEFIVPDQKRFYYSVEGRTQADRSSYRGKVILAPYGTIRTSVVRVDPEGRETQLNDIVTDASNIKPGMRIKVALQVRGQEGVQVQAKSWVASTSEPSWHVGYVDTSAQRITKPGTVALNAYISTSGTPTTVQTESFHVRDLTGNALKTLTPVQAPRPAPADVNQPFQPHPSGLYGKSLMMASCRTKSSLAHFHNGATVPWCVNDTWTYELPADPTPYSPRRSETEWAHGSEAEWSNGGGRARYREGETLVYEADMTGNLGQAAAPGSPDWHAVWQAQGLTHGVWAAQPEALMIGNGRIRVVGGGITGTWWDKTISSYEDHKTYRVKLVIYLSSVPGKGWIDAYVNGNKVLDHFYPHSGTLNEGQPEVVSRSGLYRGVGSIRGAQVGPKYEQWIKIRPYTV